jgi:UDP-N-acetylmuramate--alanine ligase
MVAEADESDRSFLKLSPAIALITNIDYEHMESYGSFEELQHAFGEFGNKVPFFGVVVACADDANLAAVLPTINRPLVTYGLDHATAHVIGTDVELGSFGGRCTVHRRRGDRLERLGVLELIVPGRHNLQNALAAVAVADWIGVDFARVADALRHFHGAERRFEHHGEAAGVMVIDDYGHHPTEIAAVLAAARATLDRRIIVAFQPHRFTRTQHLFDQFGPALAGADEIVLTEIYAASEEPVEGVTIEALADSVRRGSGRPVHVARALDDVIPMLVALARPGDAVITLGAGSIGTIPRRLIHALATKGMTA